MVIIEDRQALKRCVKQVVRHAAFVDIRLDQAAGDWTGAARAEAKRIVKQIAARQTLLLTRKEVALLSGLDALGIPAAPEELGRALEAYTDEAFFREILEVGPVRRIFLQSAPIESTDERIAPVFTVPDSIFHPGTYGVDYRACAQQIRQELTPSTLLRYDGNDQDVLRYCLFPLAEEQGTVISLFLRDERAIEAFWEGYAKSGYLRAIISTTPELEGRLIRALQGQSRLLLELTEPEHLPLALRELGVHFIPFSSRASDPLTMLGRWIGMREALWPALVDAYLPMARAGALLRADCIEQDVAQLMGGNVLAWMDP